MILRVAEQPLDLAPNTSVTLRERSPLLSDAPVAPAFSYQFELPATARNGSALGYPERPAAQDVPREIAATLELPGRVLDGRLYVDEATRKRYRVRFSYRSPFADYAARTNLRTLPVRIKPSYKFQGEYYLLGDLFHFVLDIGSTSVQITIATETFNASGVDRIRTAQNLTDTINQSTYSSAEHLYDGLILIWASKPYPGSSYDYQIDSGTVGAPHQFGSNDVRLAGYPRLTAFMDEITKYGGTYPEANVAFPPIYHKGFFDDAAEETVFSFPICNKYNPEYDEYHYRYTAPWFEDFQGPICPQFYLHYVLEVIAADAGYTIKGAPWQDDEWRDLLLYSNATISQLYYAESINNAYTPWDSPIVLNDRSRPDPYGYSDEKATIDDRESAKKHYGYPETSTGYRLLAGDRPIDAPAMMPNYSVEKLLKALRDTLGLVALIDDVQRIITIEPIERVFNHITSIPLNDIAYDYSLKRVLRPGYRYEFPTPIETQSNAVQNARPAQADAVEGYLLDVSRATGGTTYAQADNSYYRVREVTLSDGSITPQLLRLSQELHPTTDTEENTEVQAQAPFTPNTSPNLLRITSTGSVLPLRTAIPRWHMDVRTGSDADNYSVPAVQIRMEFDSSYMNTLSTAPLVSIRNGPGNDDVVTFKFDTTGDDNEIYWNPGSTGQVTNREWFENEFRPVIEDGALTELWDYVETEFISKSGTEFNDFAIILRMKNSVVTNINANDSGILAWSFFTTPARNYYFTNEGIGIALPDPPGLYEISMLMPESQGPGVIESDPRTYKNAVQDPIFIFNRGMQTQLSYAPTPNQLSSYDTPLGSYHNYAPNGTKIGDISLRPLSVHRLQLLSWLRIQMRYQELRRDLSPTRQAPNINQAWQIDGVRYLPDYVEYTISPAGIERQEMRLRAPL